MIRRLPWLRAVRPWRQWTLRARLVLATAALAAVALMPVSGTSVPLAR